MNLQNDWLWRWFWCRLSTAMEVQLLRIFWRRTLWLYLMKWIMLPANLFCREVLFWLQILSAYLGQTFLWLLVKLFNHKNDIYIPRAWLLYINSVLNIQVPSIIATNLSINLNRLNDIFLESDFCCWLHLIHSFVVAYGYRCKSV